MAPTRLTDDNGIPLVSIVGGGGGGGGDASAANQTAQTALLTTIDADTSRIPALGQATMANSAPVVIASNQSTVPVSIAAALAAGTNNIGDVDVLTVPADPFGANADAVVAAGAAGSLSAKLRRVTQGLEDLKTGITTLALPTGASTSANQTTELTDLGATSETAPASDTATSGLNGRLQRVAQRLTSLITLLPTALGGNGGLKVELASALDATNDSVAIDARSGLGATPQRWLDVDESEDEVKSSAGTLYSIIVENLHASSKRYFKIYDNTAAGTTVGTTTPVFVVPIPAGDKGFVWNSAQGMKFSTGICIAATTGFADNDTGAPGANEVICSLTFK